MVYVTDYVANGSFASLKSNVTYRSEPDHAVLVRLVDYNAGWKNDFNYVDKASFDFLKKSTLFPGDIVIANVGANAGTVFRVPNLQRPMTLGPNAILCRPSDENLDRGFLYYYLVSSVGQNSIKSILGGSAQPKFNKTDFRSLQLPIPPLPKQKAIARILGALDDKIELNRRMNETLESMARAIFKSWFVDFDPVRAKMDGQEPPGMNPETAALFPNSFEDSELGQIPKGWTFGSLSQIADLQTQSVSPGSEPLREWEHYSIPAFDDGKQPARELGSEIKSNKYVVPANCILVSKLNPRFPRVWFPDIDDVDASICSTEFMPFVPRKPEWRSFLHETVWSDSFQTEIQSRATGTTGSRQRVKPKEVAEIPIVIPSESATDALAQLTSPLHIRQLANIRASKTLANLRDTLLPKLLSGELRVPEAEKQVEEVV